MIGVLYDRCVVWSVCCMIGLLYDRYVVWSVCCMIGLLYDRCVVWSVCCMIGVLYDRCVVWSHALYSGRSLRLLWRWKAATPSKTVAHLYQAIWRHMPDDSSIHSNCYEKLKSNLNIAVYTSFTKAKRNESRLSSLSLSFTGTQLSEFVLAKSFVEQPRGRAYVLLCNLIRTSHGLR